MQLVLSILVLAFIGFYVVPNIFRYPWHTLVFLAAGIGLIFVTDGHKRLLQKLHASPRPSAKRIAAIHSLLSGLINGESPYDQPRWWIARSSVQIIYYALVGALTLAVIVALGGIFTWLDKR